VRALITGGNGFVGRHLAAHLSAHGDDVTVTDVEVDVTDVSSVAAALEATQPEVIYHLAALSHVGASWSDPSSVLTVNVVGTGVVLAAARAVVPTARVLVISSAEVYGVVHEDDLPLTESRPLAPASPYAASKAAAEQIALQGFRGFGQDVLVVRPFNHVGPGQSPAFAVAAFAKRIVDAERSGASSLTVGNLSTRRDFTDVRDVVAAYRMLAIDGRPGEISNVCSGVDVSMQAVVDALCELSGRSITLEVDPALFRPVDVPVLRGSAEFLYATTGWEPTITLATTLADVLADWRERES